jgi:hypothetical protein
MGDRRIETDRERHGPVPPPTRSPIGGREPLSSPVEREFGESSGPEIKPTPDREGGLDVTVVGGTVALPGPLSDPSSKRYDQEARGNLTPDDPRGRIRPSRLHDRWRGPPSEFEVSSVRMPDPYAAGRCEAPDEPSSEPFETTWVNEARPEELALPCVEVHAVLRRRR